MKCRVSYNELYWEKYCNVAKPDSQKRNSKRQNNIAHKKNISRYKRKVRFRTQTNKMTCQTYLLVLPKYTGNIDRGWVGGVIKFSDLGLFNTFMTPNWSPRRRPQYRVPCLVENGTNSIHASAINLQIANVDPFGISFVCEFHNQIT